MSTMWGGKVPREASFDCKADRSDSTAFVVSFILSEAQQIPSLIIFFTVVVSWLFNKMQIPIFSQESASWIQNFIWWFTQWQYFIVTFRLFSGHLCRFIIKKCNNKPKINVTSNRLGPFQIHATCGKIHQNSACLRYGLFCYASYFLDGRGIWRCNNVVQATPN